MQPSCFSLSSSQVARTQKNEKTRRFWFALAPELRLVLAWWTRPSIPCIRMTRLAILIPYRHRLTNLRILLSNIRQVRARNLEFHLISLGDSSDEVRLLCESANVNYHFVAHDRVFQIGVALNYGAKCTTADYILKQDVDCLPPPGFYDRVLMYIDELAHDPKAWANVGVFYCNRWFSNKFLNELVSEKTYLLAKHKSRFKERLKNACGNCYLVQRLHYLALGGCSERFIGWGWEDYQVAYFLEKALHPHFELSSHELPTITAVCRDEIARPKNALTNARDIVFLHRWHDPGENPPEYGAYIDHNRRILWELIHEFRKRFTS